MMRKQFWSWHGGSLVFVIAFFAAVARAESDDAPPFAMRPEPVSFENGGVQLTGVIVKPAGEGRYPAVVLVHGSGPAAHDEPAFRVHANAFVAGGFAVLLYDKRGSGKSTGDLNTSDFDDLAADVAAGVKFLRARHDIIPDQIGILGRSEGGWVGTLAACRDPRIRFVIMSSGSAVRPRQQTLWATENALRARGASAAEIKAATAAKSALWAFYRRVAEDRSVAKHVDALERERVSLEVRLRTFSRFAPDVPQVVRNPATEQPAFFRAFTRKIDYDPAPAFRSGAALLEVIGAIDEVVDPSSTSAVLEKLRKRRYDVTVRVLPAVGHSLLVTTGGGPRYPDDYPEFAVRWARERLTRSSHRRRVCDSGVVLGSRAHSHR